MRTVVLGPRPAELQSVIDRRRALGLDTYDEVWEGDYHLSPAGKRRHAKQQARLIEVIGPRVRSSGHEVTGPVNIGVADDFRIPDVAVLPAGHEDVTWNPSAALVAEIVSPDDETYEKFGFYAAHRIGEVVVDPAARSVRLFLRDAGGYREQPSSPLLGLTAEALAAELDLA